MRATATILAILILVCAAVGVFFGLKSSARIDRQRRLLASLEECIASQTETIASMQGVMVTARDSVTGLRGERDQLTEDLAQTRATLEETRETLAQTEETLERTQEALAALEARVPALEQQVADQQERITGLSADLDETKTALGQMSLLFARAKGKLRAFESVVLANPELWQKMVHPSKVVLDGEGASAGAVLAAKSEGITAVKFIGSVALNKGDTVRLLRDKDEVGVLKVGDVYRTLVVCQATDDAFDGWIQNGDVMVLEKSSE